MKTIASRSMQNTMKNAAAAAHIPTRIAIILCSALGSRICASLVAII